MDRCLVCGSEFLQFDATGKIAIYDCGRRTIGKGGNKHGGFDCGKAESLAIEQREKIKVLEGIISKASHLSTLLYESPAPVKHKRVGEIKEVLELFLKNPNLKPVDI